MSLIDLGVGDSRESFSSSLDFTGFGVSVETQSIEMRYPNIYKHFTFSCIIFIFQMVLHERLVSSSNEF